MKARNTIMWSIILLIIYGGIMWFVRVGVSVNAVVAFIMLALEIVLIPLAIIALGWFTKTESITSFFIGLAIIMVGCILFSLLEILLTDLLKFEWLSWLGTIFSFVNISLYLYLKRNHSKVQKLYP